jgi:MFS family permease
MRRSAGFLVSLSLPALTLALAFGVNNPNLFHLVLSRFVEEGILQDNRINTALGILGLFSLATSAIAQPIFGALSDRTRSRFGRRYPYMLLGVALLLMSFLFEIQATNLALLAIGSVFTSIALSAMQSPFHALIPDQVNRDQMGTASGIKTVLELVGVMISGGIVAIFLGKNEQPIFVAILVSIMMFIAILFAMKFIPENNPVFTERRPTASDRYKRRFEQKGFTVYGQMWGMRFKHIRRRRAFMWWLLHRVCLFGSFGILSKFTITYIQDVFGFTQDEARAMQGQFIVIIGLVILLTPLISGIISDRIGRRRVIIIAGLIAATSTLITSQTRSLYLAVGMMAITGMGTSVFFSVGWAMVTSIVPKRQAAFYMGVTNVATSLGTALGLMGGFVVDFVNDWTNTDTQGYMVILMMAAGFYLVSAFAIYQTYEKEELPKPFTHTLPVTN